MPTVVELPDGATATLRDRTDLSNKEARHLRRAAVKAGSVMQKLQVLGVEDLRPAEDGNEEADAAAVRERSAKMVSILSELSDSENDSLDLYQREAIALLLTAWSLDRPLPETADDVDNLPLPIYQPLADAAAKFRLDEDFSPDGGDGPLVTTTTESSEG